MAGDPVAICPFIIKNINIGIWNPKSINTHLSDNTPLFLILNIVFYGREAELPQSWGSFSFSSLNVWVTRIK